MVRFGVGVLSLLVCLVLSSGCSSSGGNSNPIRKGAKVNVNHFFQHPSSYQGKTITLPLIVDEAIDRDQDQSLRQFTNRYVNFAAQGTKGERFHVVIRIPQDIPIPDAATGDELVVTFLCSRGTLQQGNEATAIQKR
jgi:hypothetical protein